MVGWVGQKVGSTGELACFLGDRLEANKREGYKLAARKTLTGNQLATCYGQLLVIIRGVLCFGS